MALPCGRFRIELLFAIVQVIVNGAVIDRMTLLLKKGARIVLSLTAEE